VCLAFGFVSREAVLERGSLRDDWGGGEEGQGLKRQRMVKESLPRRSGQSHLHSNGTRLCRGTGLSSLPSLL